VVGIVAFAVKVVAGIKQIINNTPLSIHCPHLAKQKTTEIIQVVGV
jgi:hypothetical protein